MLMVKEDALYELMVAEMPASSEKVAELPSVEKVQLLDELLDFVKPVYAAAAAA
jgi:hypothetical protein